MAIAELTPSRKLVLLKLLSLGTGAFLIVGGIWAILSIMLGGGGGFVYFVGALYTIAFGSIVLTVEAKDKFAPLSPAYGWLSTYLKFLTLQVRMGRHTALLFILTFDSTSPSSPNAVLARPRPRIAHAPVKTHCGLSLSRSGARASFT